MTRLLVSVRDPQEARVALAAGADLIDIKEPSLGSLGRASDEVIAAVLREVAGRRPVSIALGELRDWLAAPATETLSFAKLGLAGCAAFADWPVHWAQALQSVVPSRCAVAVIYADWRAAEAPPPQDVLTAARQLGCGAVLVDTYNKRAGGLLDHWRIDEVRQLIAEARAAGMLAVIAGSLNADTVPQIAPLLPDYVAVRGAVCRGGRDGPLDGRMIEGLREHLIAGSIPRPAERNA